MTDRETVELLIARDNETTRQFFFVRCRPLLTAIMRLVFSYPVDYDEMVNELYSYLMEDDCARLRRFEYRSTLCQWLKVVATRFFIHKRDIMIENISREPLYQRNIQECGVDTASFVARTADVATLMSMMPNRRYAETLRRLVLEDAEPEAYAAEIGVTVENLYNIKRRALAALARIALKYYSYER